jgi:hypothetical protein
MLLFKVIMVQCSYLCMLSKLFITNFWVLQCLVGDVNFFFVAWGGGIKVHSTLWPLNGLLCQPRVIMIMEKSVE